MIHINLRDDMQGGALRGFPLDRVRADNAAALADIIEDFDEASQDYKVMALPDWVDQKVFNRIERILEAVSLGTLSVDQHNPVRT